jgi:predicted permease
MISFFRKLGWLARRKSKEDQLAAELQFHLEEEAEERQAGGLQDSEARRAARQELGNLGLIEEDTRAAWAWTWLEQLIQDLRYAVRAMVHNPGFTILATLSLALGIGANTAIYSFMDALLMRSLPVADPQRLAVLNWHNKVEEGTVFKSASGSRYDDPEYGSTARIFPYPAFELFQKSGNVFSTLFAYYPTRKLNLMIHGQAELGAGEFVSGQFFRGLEVAPAAGRLLTPDDDRAGALPVVVLGFGFSQDRFGDAAAAVGQTILINNLPFNVAGVTPPGFFGVDPAAAAQFYVPLHANLLLEPNRGPGGMARRYLNGNDYWIEIMGRLRPGVTMASAQATLAPMFHEWVATTAANDLERRNLPGFHLTGGATGIDTLRRRYSQPLFLLLTMVGLILAIACANIANLLLARAAARQREMAVRLSMGAGRWRVIRQLLTESVLLASVGGTLGILFALWGVRSLTALLATGNDSFPLHPELNWHVLAAAAALSILTGLLFGLAPALQATRVEVMPVLKGDRTVQPHPRMRWLRFTLSHALVVSQIAISLLLLVGAGLFVRTLSHLQSIELGFNRENILLFKLNARQAGHRDPEILSFYNGLQERFAAIPGTRSATVSNSPLIGEGTWGAPVVPLGVEISDRAPDGHGDFASASATHILTVGPEFFTTMKIPLLAGREFDERDKLGSPGVAIVNEVWAKENFAGRNPLGQRVVVQTMGLARQEMEIVGVAKNARYGDLRGEYPAIVYMAFRQNLFRPAEEMTYALRAAGDPLTLVNAVREIVRQADARVPVTGVKTQADMIERTMTAELTFARLCTGFAILALAIAFVGLYGTMSYTVARRTGEIGIRMALGARGARVVWMVMNQVFAMVAVGLAIGVPAAYGSSRLIASVLYGIKANDPVAIGIAVGTLLVAAALAGYVPARRASRIDPMTALRDQ